MPDPVLRVVPAIADVPRDVWNSLANPGGGLANGVAAPADGLNGDGPPADVVSDRRAAFNPFVAHDFLSSLEESGAVSRRAGWLPHHLVLEEEGTAVGVVPCYLKTHSQGEYVFDQSWANAFEQAGGDYYPKLQVSVPFTPVNGPRLLVAPGPAAERRRGTLARGLAALGQRLGVSSVHATFLTEPDRTAFETAGWLARTDQQFHWQNRGYRDFDDFLAGLASRKRKQIRRERREAVESGITIEPVTGGAITEAHWDAFFAFYMDTGARKWGRPYLDRRFFSLLGARMADRVLLVMARRGGRAIAGALNLIGSDALYGRYWGALEEHPFLHFEICYHQAIDYAITHGLARVEAGAQGEHKLARGYEPVTTHSAHFIAHVGLRRAVADYLRRERAEVAAIGAVLAEHAPYRRDSADCPGPHADDQNK